MKMGTCFKRAIFEVNTASSIAQWHRAVKRRPALRKASSSIEFSQEDADLAASVVVQLSEVKNHESSLNNGTEVRNYESSQEGSTGGEI